MNQLKTLQTPSTLDECIQLMRSYVYIDKYNGVVIICDVSPYLVPGFILGVCGQIPFLRDCAQSYIADVMSGVIDEVTISKHYSQEMQQNSDTLRQLHVFKYTPTDCDLVLTVMLNGFIYSMYGQQTRNFDQAMADRVGDICNMANVYPITFKLPSTFREVMKTALVSLPELRTNIMSCMCPRFDFPEVNVWSLVKRYIWMQVQNYQMGTFLRIGEWYEAREKTLAHVDPEIVKEMARYEKCVHKMQALSKNKYPLNAFRIFNPQSMLTFLRQFPASAYCASLWKYGNDTQVRRSKLARFNIDIKQLKRLLSIPVKYTIKRKLKHEEIEKISSKRFKQLDTDFTADDLEWKYNQSPHSQVDSE